MDDPFLKKVHFSDRKSYDFFTGLQSDEEMNLEGIKEIFLLGGTCGKG